MVLNQSPWIYDYRSWHFTRRKMSVAFISRILQRSESAPIVRVRDSFYAKIITLFLTVISLYEFQWYCSSFVLIVVAFVEWAGWIRIVVERSFVGELNNNRFLVKPLKWMKGIFCAGLESSVKSEYEFWHLSSMPFLLMYWVLSMALFANFWKQILLLNY